MTDGGSQRPVPVDAAARIQIRQDEPAHFRRLLAYSHLYNRAQWWRRIRSLGTFTLATAAPIIALTFPATGDVLAAVSAGWLVLGRTTLSWLEQHARYKAVQVQELYDVRLFYLPWNSALAGRQPGPEDIASAAHHIRNRDRFTGWYTVDVADTPWPGDVLLCQRQSLVWSRRDHRGYGTAVLATGIAWLLVGLTVAFVRDLTIAEYLIKIFLPSAPAFLDSYELARAHWSDAAAQEEIEDRINEIWSSYHNNPAAIPITECREIQDSAFALRRNGQRVPTLFYLIRKATSDRATAAGARTLLDEADST
jgi:hypothetical protein